MWPKQLFWVWVLKSVLKSLGIGAVLGGLWMALAFYVIPSQSAASWMFILSFFVDVTFIFITVTMATIIGMSVHTWDVVNKVIWDGRKMLVTRYLMALLLTMAVGVVMRYVNSMYQYPYDSLTPTLFTFLVATVMTFSKAYHVYCVYAVMDPKERRTYLGEDGSRSAIKKIGHWMIPFYDKNRVALPWLHAGIIMVLSLATAQWLANVWHNQQLIVLGYAVISSLLFTLWGVCRRLFDVLKPWGARERLYPYFEDYR